MYNNTITFVEKLFFSFHISFKSWADGTQLPMLTPSTFPNDSTECWNPIVRNEFMGGTFTGFFPAHRPLCARLFVPIRDWIHRKVPLFTFITLDSFQFFVPLTLLWSIKTDEETHPFGYRIYSEISAAAAAFIMKLVVFSALLTVATAIPQLLPSTLEDEFFSQFPTQSEFQRSQLPITFQSISPINRSGVVRRPAGLKSQQFQVHPDGSYNHRQVVLTSSSISFK